MSVQKSMLYRRNQDSIDILSKEELNLVGEINEKQKRLNTVREFLYQAKQDKIHIEEIFRLASIEFPRLRKQTGHDLTQQDIDELEKLIDRARSPEGIKDIAIALAELKKYYPEDIRSNLYGLLQKIIIGGPYGGWKKKRK